MSFDLFLRVGGYWSSDDAYLGGEAHQSGRHVGVGFSRNSLWMLITKVHGYTKNMRKVSWFQPETANKRVDIEDEAELEKVVEYAISSGALTLYVVREDDPYISRRKGCTLGFLNDDDDDNVDGDGDGSDDGNGDGSDDDGSESGSDNDDFDHRESDSDSSSGTYTEVNVVDEKKYKKFRLGQEFRTIQAFKYAIHRYAVKKRDIKYEKSDSKRVVLICSNKKCPWRLSASINSISTRVVVRSLNDDHNCTWQGRVSLLTNSRIAEMYIDEFRLNPDFSATMLQEKLLSRNINVSWTICERTRLKCLQTFVNVQAESFAKIFDYIGELKRSNPGSIVECEVRETKFHRFYVCFQALKDGWKAACRRIIHVDGT